MHKNIEVPMLQTQDSKAAVLMTEVKLLGTIRKLQKQRQKRRGGYDCTLLRSALILKQRLNHSNI